MRMLCNSLMNSGRHSHIHRFKQDFGPAFIVLEVSDDIMVENVDKQCILVQKVNAPYSLEQVSIATKNVLYVHSKNNFLFSFRAVQ